MLWFQRGKADLSYCKSNRNRAKRWENAEHSPDAGGHATCPAPGDGPDRWACTAELRRRHTETHVLPWGTAAKRAGRPLPGPFLKWLQNIPACETHASHPPRTLTSLNVPEVAGDKGSDTDHTDEVADTHGHTRVLARTAPGGQGTAARPGWASAPAPPLLATQGAAGGAGPEPHGLSAPFLHRPVCLVILEPREELSKRPRARPPPTPSPGASPRRVAQRPPRRGQQGQRRQVHRLGRRGPHLRVQLREVVSLL